VIAEGKKTEGNKTMTNTLNDLIERFTARANEIERAITPTGCSTVTSHNWIVVDDFGALTFELTPEGKKKRAVCTGHSSAHKVNRFTCEDAQRLAKACDARAVFWEYAATEELESLRAQVAELNTL
jgi:hypothetical protein